VKRTLLLWNLVLVASAAAGVVHLRREWVETRAREQAVLRKRIEPAPSPPMRPPPPPEPVDAAAYNDIARKALFFEDRNPIVVVEQAPPTIIPTPVFPLLHGVLDLGEGPMAIMSEDPKGRHRDYRPGDQVGAFKLVAVNNEELVLEYGGKTITKKVDELLKRSTAALPAVDPADPPERLAKVLAAPGEDMADGTKACRPRDTSPPGTVVDGMRKVIESLPFHSKCFWK
jgi:hypothetical protein